MNISNPPGPFRPSWDTLEQYLVPEWYLDAKFGIFIHWGVYSVPAFGNEWYARHMYSPGKPEHEHHVKTYGPVDKFGYKDFIPMFTAEKFDATEWVDLFEASGAKFVVPVAEHHDGFAMYPTKQNRWHAVEMGPKRDIIGELAAATRDKGLVFGLSSHRAEHWWFLNSGREIPSDVSDPDYAELYGPAHPGSSEFGKNPPSEPFMEDWLTRCAELVDAYRPQLFWFDWWIEQPEFAPYLRRFASYYYNRAYAWGQGVAINYKHNAFPEKAAVYDIERGQVADISPRFWQNDTAVAKNSWGYVDPMDYKTPGSLIQDLVDIVSKNGALLLNIGPRADGTIPQEDQDILRAIGAWLAVNGESIYGTRPWKVFGEGPTEIETGYFKDTSRAPFTPEDIRFTQKDGDLYVAVLAQPRGELCVKSLATGLKLETREVASVALLGGGEVAWTRDTDGLKIAVPTQLPSADTVVFKVSFSS